jgi:Mrp family chromosome partitioning ATPase
MRRGLARELICKLQIEGIGIVPSARASDVRSERAQAEQIRPDLSLPPGTACIGVLSGKGGVGKSLVTALLATAFAEAGHPAGILDADITGPSIPRMFGLSGELAYAGEKLVPARTARLGIQVISINLLIERDDDPVIWRGPLLANTVAQFVSDVQWDGLDYLLVDLPPGTSDIPLTVMQRLPLAGVIVVTTPQELAGMIVRKAIRMTALLEVPVLGLIENMVHAVCPHCHQPFDLFGSERAPQAAGTAGIPVLGSLALDPVLAALCDSGEIESYLSNPLAGAAQVLARTAQGRRA